MEILDTALGEESGVKASSLPGTDPILQGKPVNPFRRVQLTCSELAFSRKLPDVEEILTIPMPAISQEQANDDIPTLRLPVPLIDEKMPEDNIALALGQDTLVRTFDIESIDALLFETASLSIVKRKRIKKKIGRFFANTLLFMVSAFLICLLIFIIIIASDPLYRITLILLFLITFSYFCSIQAKRIFPPNKRLYISSTQFIRIRGKKLKYPKNKDMEHMKLIKQDTTSYLLALKKKDIKKGFSK